MVLITQSEASTIENSGTEGAAHDREERPALGRN